MKKGPFVIGIIIVMVSVFLLIYPFWRVHNAKTRINHFFQEISVGTPMETVESLSRKLDLNIIKSAGNDSRFLTLIVWDGWAFARWTCFVSFENNKVVRTEVSFID